MYRKVRRQCIWRPTFAGYRKSFTKPKSSPVASSVRLAVRQLAFTSVTSHFGGQMPSHDAPSTPVQLSHSCFSTSARRSVWRFPRGASKNSCSRAPELLTSSFPEDSRQAKYRGRRAGANTCMLNLLTLINNFNMLINISLFKQTEKVNKLWDQLYLIIIKF